MSPAARNLADSLGVMRVLLWIGAGTSCPAPPRIPADSPDEAGLAFRLAMGHYGDRAVIEVNVGQGFRLSRLAAVLGKGRIRDLILQQGWGDLEPTRGHRAIAALAAEDAGIELVTVNYDPLLEKALNDVGLTTRVVCSAETVPFLRLMELCVVKAHGCPFVDAVADHLLMLEEDLVAPPEWLVNFLRGRLQERVFVYSGFSGNAPYVRASVAAVVRALNQNMARAYAVDIRSTESAYDELGDFPQFLRESNVARADYSPDGADQFFEDVANHFFRTIALGCLETATNRAEQRMAVNSADLRTIVNEMSFGAIRTLAGKLHYLFGPKGATVRVRDVCIDRLFKWLLLFSASGILQASSFRPVLAVPYRPGPDSTAAAPMIFFDAGDNDADECVKRINQLADKPEFKNEFPVGGSTRWFVVLLKLCWDSQR